MGTGDTGGGGIGCVVWSGLGLGLCFIPPPPPPAGFARPIIGERDMRASDTR